MKANPPSRAALSLEAAESSAPAGDAMRKASDQSASTENAKRDLRISTSDEFLAQAAKEYQEGRIDQALWRRAADQGANDASLVIAAYLRARATALQLQRKRTAVAQGRAHKSDPARGTGERDGGSEPRRSQCASGCLCPFPGHAIEVPGRRGCGRAYSRRRRRVAHCLAAGAGTTGRGTHRHAFSYPGRIATTPGERGNRRGWTPGGRFASEL